LDEKKYEKSEKIPGVLLTYNSSNIAKIWTFNKSMTYKKLWKRRLPKSSTS
jgi:hypothetical protein